MLSVSRLPMSTFLISWRGFNLWEMCLFYYISIQSCSHLINQSFIYKRNENILFIRFHIILFFIHDCSTMLDMIIISCNFTFTDFFPFLFQINIIHNKKKIKCILFWKKKIVKKPKNNQKPTKWMEIVWNQSIRLKIRYLFT